MRIAWKENILGMKTIVANFIEGVKTFFSGIVNIVKGILNIVKGLFTGDFELIKEGIMQIFTGLWQAIKGGFMVTFNAVGAIVVGAITVVWNSIRAIVDGISWLIESVGGFLGLDFDIPSLPQIPSFQTGGIMPHTGLAMLHEGEKIIPKNQAGRQGTTFAPQITITGNNINSDMDLDRIVDEINRRLAPQMERMMERGSI